MMSDLLKIIAIKPSGAVLIGKHFTIDGFERRNIHVITHAHADHLGGLNQSVKYVEKIIATPATIDLILELGYVLNSNGLKALFKRKAYPLSYHEKLMIGDEELELLPAHHILGASQVVVRTGKYVIGYTGDFKLGGETEIIKEPDILIMETTYGDPNYRRPFKHYIEDFLVDLVFQGIETMKRVVIYGYHGKLQEAMKILRSKGVDYPFVMPPKIYRITRIAEKHGYGIGEYYNSLSREGREIIREGFYIYFDHMMRAKRRRLDGSRLNIVLSGWEFQQPVRRLDEYSWLVAMSDHADFDELIQYVEESKPRIVVLDASRQGSPKPLKRELEKRGWRVVILPVNDEYYIGIDNYYVG